MPKRIPASFWRSGTLRCPFFRAADLATYQQELRDDIILSTLGTPPNADQRPIDGLGEDGFKTGAPIFMACIIGAPGEGLTDQRLFGPLPGPSWAEEGTREGLGQWDVILRLAHVEKRYEVAWPDAVCHEMLVACAHAAISSHKGPIVPAETLLPYVQAAREAFSSGSGGLKPVHVPIRILSANTEQVFTTRVPIDPFTMDVWEPLETWYDRYLSSSSGEFDGGDTPPQAIELEFAMDTSRQLPTGHQIDAITVSGHSVRVTILDVGSPVILVLAASLPRLQLPPYEDHDHSLPGVIHWDKPDVTDSAASPQQLPPPSEPSEDDAEVEDEVEDDAEFEDGAEVEDEDHGLVCSHPKTLDEHTELQSLLGSIRDQAKLLSPSLSSRPAAAICFVGDMDGGGDDTIGGKYICSCQANIVVRSASVSGKFDRDLPEAILAALAVAHGLKDSVAYEAWSKAQKRGCGGEQSPDVLEGEVVWASVGYPSGVAMAGARMHEEEIGRRANAIIFPKTAREIMRGEVLIPERVMDRKIEAPLSSESESSGSC